MMALVVAQKFSRSCLSTAMKFLIQTESNAWAETILSSGWYLTKCPWHFFNQKPNLTYLWPRGTTRPRWITWTLETKWVQKLIKSGGHAFAFIRQRCMIPSLTHLIKSQKSYSTWKWFRLCQNTIMKDSTTSTIFKWTRECSRWPPLGLAFGRPSVTWEAFTTACMCWSGSLSYLLLPLSFRLSLSRVLELSHPIDLNRHRRETNRKTKARKTPKEQAIKFYRTKVITSSWKKPWVN